MNGIPPRILVTDAQDKFGPAAIRSLSAAGYRVGATATARWAPGFWSRGCSFRAIVGDPHVGVDGYVAQLERIVREGGYDVLLPGTDEALYAISTRRERLDPYVEMGLPAHEVVERALDKSCLAAEAAKVGLPTPDSHVCDDDEQALAAARAFGFPCLVKGTRTIVETDGRLTRHPSTFVSDERGLLDAQRRIGRCIVQRRFPGGMMFVAGVATDRGMLGSVVARYRRTWPPSAGMASFSETMNAPGHLTDKVSALVKAIGWRGLFQLQLIEAEDGTTRPIDFNPRLFGSIELARAAGVPLAALWCAWLLHQDPEPATARAGVAYRWEDGDARHIIWLVRRGHFRTAARAAMPRRGTAHPYFDARDPLPFFAHCVELAHARLSRARRKGAA